MICSRKYQSSQRSSNHNRRHAKILYISKNELERYALQQLVFSSYPKIWLAEILPAQINPPPSRHSSAAIKLGAHANKLIRSALASRGPHIPVCPQLAVAARRRPMRPTRLPDLSSCHVVQDDYEKHAFHLAGRISILATSEKLRL